MQFSNLNDLLTWAPKGLSKGPTAFVFCEDDVEIASTVEHTVGCGFRNTVVLGHDLPNGLLDISDTVTTAETLFADQKSVSSILNSLIKTIPDQWVYYCFNAEYLFFPFSESRSIGELLTFCNEERRTHVLSFVVDLYARYLWDFPNATNRDECFFDRSGYFANSRKNEWGQDLDRQLDFFGGLRSRFEEFVPPTRRKIDRVAIFKTKPGLEISPDHTLNDEEYNTFACPWHNSPTASIASFRSAKALKRNPKSTFEIESFFWHGSAEFKWNSQQLMEAGLMEPGQWF